jgi:hypothetical protein
MPALLLTISGGVACAQPPAQGFDASGIGAETVPDSGYQRLQATQKPFSELVSQANEIPLIVAQVDATVGNKWLCPGPLR